MKIIVTIISTDLITNSFSAPFCPSLQTRSKNQVFNKLVVWYREIVLFLVYSESRSTPKPYRIQCLNVEYLTFKECSYMLFFVFVHLFKTSSFISSNSPCQSIILFFPRLPLFSTMFMRNNQ